MTDGRTTVFGAGYVSFSGDNSSATGVPNRKQGRGAEYYAQEETDNEEKREFRESEFIDRSAQLNASLSSLAMINASLIKKKPVSKPIEKIDSKKVNPIKEQTDTEEFNQ